MGDGGNGEVTSCYWMVCLGGRGLVWDWNEIDHLGGLVCFKSVSTDIDGWESLKRCCFCNVGGIWVRLGHWGMKTIHHSSSQKASQEYARTPHAKKIGAMPRGVFEGPGEIGHWSAGNSHGEWRKGGTLVVQLTAAWSMFFDDRK